MPSALARTEIDAVLFDLDGVLTTTRSVHAAAWKDTFDAFLDAWDAEHATSTPAFNDVDDYAAHVDGKPRQDGVRDFLASRGITLPEGTPDSAPEEESVWGLSNRKQLLVESELEKVGVEVFPGSIAYVRELREAGMKTGVVSSSRNCATVLDYAGITNLFDVRVDGDTALDLGLPGKPAPDMFLEAARLLDVRPGRAAVVEDAISGVAAGKAGDFRLVIGVDRDGHAEALTAAGADVVVKDLSELLSPPGEQVHRAGPPEHRLLAAAKRITASGDYPTDPWRIVERVYNPERVEQAETLFAVANGYLGIRGSFEEGSPSFQPGTLLNGFHETWPIVYPERAHGYATTGQTIVRVPDGTSIRLFVDEDPIDCTRTEVLEFERSLDMGRGAMDRSVVYQLPDGRRFWVRSKRFVSLVNRHLAGIRYQVTALDSRGRLVLSSDLVTSQGEDAGPIRDQRRSRTFTDEVLTSEGDQVDGARVIRAYRTVSSGLTVAAGMDHEYDTEHMRLIDVKVDDERARAVFDVTAPAGTTVTLVKWLAYHYGDDDAADLRYRAEASLYRARAIGYRQAFASHVEAVREFWERSDVEWDGYPAAQQAMHFSLFSVWQATARAEGYGSPAKGLTGTGYEGHYFWDTEVYVLPFLIHTSPEIARSLLMHRVRMLDDARERAREVGCSGALFPWRTISGKEASAYYAAGTAQYHIDADISYAIDQYVRMTGDDDLLYRHGAEVLVETARMWADLGFFSDRHGGRFCIAKVTGPDEYTTVVDNNLFTNLMAAENMTIAAAAVDRLHEESPADYQRLIERTGLRLTEVENWRRAAAKIHIPYDDEAQVHLQDDGFLDLEPWDFAHTPPEDYPLLLHYHPLVIYRHQVIKQADVELATVLLPGRFTPQERQRIFDYYDPLTTGDSSLSESIQAIAAADVGKYRTAEEYLIDAMVVDVADTAGNVRDGVHVASAGGTWMSVVFGFGGFRWRRGELTFRPMLPTRARRLRFPLRIRDSLLRVTIETHQVTYAVEEGPALTIRHYDEAVTVAPGSPMTFSGEFHTHDHEPGSADEPTSGEAVEVATSSE